MSPPPGAPRGLKLPLVQAAQLLLLLEISWPQICPPRWGGANTLQRVWSVALTSGLAGSAQRARCGMLTAHHCCPPTCSRLALTRGRWPPGVPAQGAVEASAGLSSAALCCLLATPTLRDRGSRRKDSVDSHRVVGHSFSREARPQPQLLLLEPCFWRFLFTQIKHPLIKPLSFYF